LKLREILAAGSSRNQHWHIYYRQDRFAEALGCYERAYRGLLNQKDEEGIGRGSQQYGYCYIT